MTRHLSLYGILALGPTLSLPGRRTASNYLSQYGMLVLLLLLPLLLLLQSTVVHRVVFSKCELENATRHIRIRDHFGLGMLKICMCDSSSIFVGPPRTKPKECHEILLSFSSDLTFPDREGEIGPEKVFSSDLPGSAVKSSDLNVQFWDAEIGWFNPRTKEIGPEKKISSDLPLWIRDSLIG